MTSITDILAMEPRYNVEHIKRKLGNKTFDLLFANQIREHYLNEEKELNAAKAMLGKKLAEALKLALDALEQSEGEWHLVSINQAEAALAEWNKLDEVK